MKTERHLKVKNNPKQSMREPSLNGRLTVSSLSTFEELSCGSSSPIGGLCRRNWKSFHCSDRENDSKASPWHLQPNVLSAVYVSWVQPVICQVFFIFFIKSQLLLLAFYIVAVRQSGPFRRNVSRRRRVQQFRTEAALCFDLWLKGGSISLDRISCMYVVVHMRAARTSSSWRISGVWVLTAAIGGNAAVRCPLASSWQTRRDCMPIVDGADLNWWPHPSCCIFAPGSGPCHCGRVLSKLKQAQVRMLSNQQRRLVLPLTDVPFGPQCCVSQTLFSLTTGPSLSLSAFF